MTASETFSSLRAGQFAARRRLLFGDSSLKVYGTTPAAGETFLKEFTGDWGFGRRVWRTTDEGQREGSSAWQFQIVAADDWKTSETFMHAATVFTIDDRRFVIHKIEKPAGNSLIWKAKAQEAG